MAGAALAVRRGEIRHHLDGRRRGRRPLEGEAHEVHAGERVGEAARIEGRVDRGVAGGHAVLVHAVLDAPHPHRARAEEAEGLDHRRDLEVRGAGGNINLSGSVIQLSNGASISATSSGNGNAGNIQINAGNQFAMTNSSVTTEANQASGGAIKITTNPNGTVQLTDSTISASVLDGTGGGGSVNIDPQYVVLQNSQILAKAVFGPGGNILITTNLLLPDSTSLISASSQFGQQGTIIIQSPISPASGKIVPLGQKPLPRPYSVSAAQHWPAGTLAALPSQDVTLYLQNRVTGFQVRGIRNWRIGGQHGDRARNAHKPT